MWRLGRTFHILCMKCADYLSAVERKRLKWPRNRCRWPPNGAPSAQCAPKRGPAAAVPGDEMYFYAIHHPNESGECKHLYLFRRRIRDETMERINIPPMTDRCVAISAQIMQKVGEGALYTTGRADKMNDSGSQSAKNREELAVGRGLLRRKRRFLLQKNANWGLQLSGFFCIIPS